MSSSSQCPPNSQLAALLRGTLAAAVESTVTRHLDSCARCREQLERIAAGGEEFSADVAQKLGDESTREIPDQLVAVMERFAEGPAAADTQVLSKPSTDGPPPTELPADFPRPPAILDRYQLIREIGRGGMGVVFAARDVSLDRLVALKVLGPQWAADSVARQRFFAEARAAAAVNSRHVVTLHAVEDRGTWPYLVMEYVPGSNLQQLIDAHGPLPLSSILQIGTRVASGLAAAHDKGLVHRDIKPGNVLVVKSTGAVKLTDFGLARAASDARLTKAGLIVGTLAYMAPEQLDGHAIDQRADLYALGCVFYAMCAGRAPIEGDHTIAIMRRVIEGRVPALADVCPHLPAWLVAIIERLMARRPEDRYGSASEVVQLLRQHRSDPSDPQVVELSPVGPPGSPPPAPPTLVVAGAEAAREMPTIAGVRASHAAATVQLAEPPIAQPSGPSLAPFAQQPPLAPDDSFRIGAGLAATSDGGPLIVARRSAARQARMGRGTGRLSLLIIGGAALVCVLLLGVAYGVWKATHGASVADAKQASQGALENGRVGAAVPNGPEAAADVQAKAKTKEKPSGGDFSGSGAPGGDTGRSISDIAAQSTGVASNGAKLPPFQGGPNAVGPGAIGGTQGGPRGGRPMQGGMSESEMRRMLDAGKFIEVQSPGVNSRRFFVLGDAIANSPSGGELVLHGDHIWETPPLDIRGRALTIRPATPAAGKIRFVHDGAFRGPMLQSDSPLSLEGLTLVDDASDELNAGLPQMPNFIADGIVSSLGAELKLDRCKIGTNRRVPCVWVESAARVEFRNCQFSAERGTGIMWRDVQNRAHEQRGVTIEQCFTRARVGMFLDIRHESAFQMSLVQFVCLADDGLHIELPAAVGALGDPRSKLFDTRECVFDCANLLTFWTRVQDDGPQMRIRAASELPLRFQWKGERNIFRAGIDFVVAQPFARAAIVKTPSGGKAKIVGSLDAWRQYWPTAESDAQVLEPKYGPKGLTKSKLLAPDAPLTGPRAGDEFYRRGGLFADDDARVAR